ncbi:MAG: protein kinase domain-containing protein [Persicimonas sp.]
MSDISTTIEGETPDTRYRPAGVIGRGGMATVFRAWDEAAEMDVALKVLHEHLAGDDAIVEAFEREAAMMQSLDHPSVVRVFGMTQVDGRRAIAMELCESDDLADRLSSRGQFDEQEAVDIAVAILEALSAVHDRGMVHRDIKPHNVLFDEEGQAKLIDFGIGQAEELMAADEAGHLGTVEYMAPERIDGLAVDARSDIYSVGVLLFELLCGHVPYRAESASAVFRMHREAEVADPKIFCSDISERTRRAVMCALSKHPEERFDSAEAMSAALRGEGEPPEPMPPHPDWRALVEHVRGDRDMAAPIEQEGHEWVVYIPVREFAGDGDVLAMSIPPIRDAIYEHIPYDARRKKASPSVDLESWRLFDHYGLARGLSREGVDRILDSLGKARSLARYAKRPRTKREPAGWLRLATHPFVAPIVLGVLAVAAVFGVLAGVNGASALDAAIYVASWAVAGVALTVFLNMEFLREWWLSRVSHSFLLDFGRPLSPPDVGFGLDRHDVELLDAIDSPRIAASFERAVEMALHLDEFVDDDRRRRRLSELVDDVRRLARQIARAEDEVAAVRPGELASRIRQLDRRLADEEDSHRAQSLIDQKEKLRRQLTDRDHSQQRLQTLAQRLHELSTRLERLAQRTRPPDDATADDQPVILDLDAELASFDFDKLEHAEVSEPRASAGRTSRDH